MDDNYQKLIEEITNRVIESIKSGEAKKTDWESVREIDYSFGGALKVFTGILGLKNIDIIIGEFKKGQSLKKHYHKTPTEEVYYVLEGELEVNIEDKKITVKKGDMVSVPPNVVHWPINHLDETCRILFILSPKEKEKPIIIE